MPNDAPRGAGREMHGAEASLRAAAGGRESGLFAYEKELVRRHLSPGNGRRVLVSGSGAGREMGVLAGQGWDVVGFDHAFSQLRAFKAGDGAAAAAEAEALAFKDGSFDAVIAFNFLCDSVEAEARRRVVREWRRVLKPGGTLVLWDRFRGGHLRRLIRWCARGPARLGYFLKAAFPLGEYPAAGAFFGREFLRRDAKARRWSRADVLALELKWLKRQALFIAEEVWRAAGRDAGLRRWGYIYPVHFFSRGELAALFQANGFLVKECGFVPFEPQDPLCGSRLSLVAVAAGE